MATYLLAAFAEVGGCFAFWAWLSGISRPRKRKELTAACPSSTPPTTPRPPLFAILAPCGGKLWGAIWLDPVMRLVGAALVATEPVAPEAAPEAPSVHEEPVYGTVAVNRTAPHRHLRPRTEARP